MDTLNILGINITKLNKQAVLKRIIDYLNSNQAHYLTTPNPEIILGSLKDEELFYILNKADLSIPDGFGLTCAAWACLKRIHRYTGADLVIDILKIAEKSKKRVAILVWSGGLSRPDDISFALKKNFPGLEFRVDEIDRSAEYKINDDIIKYAPAILFVALGSPWQEKYIYHILPKMPSVSLAAGIGGAFDFLTEKIKRAPKIIRFIGLEWLWRLYKQPWRWKRIYNAVIVFPYKFVRWRFILPFCYRKNVACLVYKKNNNEYKILLVKRSEMEEHWQLPQGGTDGMTVENAAVNELKEELNIDNIKIINVFNNIYKYNFGERTSKYGTKVNKLMGYKGQKQSLFIAEFTGEDKNIKINYWDHSGWKWVDSEKLLETVHPIRQQAAKIFLEKFNKHIKKLIK